MKIAVLASNASWQELTTGNDKPEWLRTNNIEMLSDHKDADAYFNLNDDAYKQDYSRITKPVFINSVSQTLKNINAASNIYRINGWNGFLKRAIWEVSGNAGECELILNSIQKKSIVVADEPGFISARIIAMIINEAFYAKGENVSTDKEIDIAMRLGTNYPQGPFEWAQEIGLTNIFELLSVLSEADNRYKPSSLLEKEARHL